MFVVLLPLVVGCTITPVASVEVAPSASSSNAVRGGYGHHQRTWLHRAGLRCILAVFQLTRRLNQSRVGIALFRDTHRALATTGTPPLRVAQFDLAAMMKLDLVFCVSAVGWVLYLHAVMTSLDSNSTVGIHTTTNATTYVGCSYHRCTLPLTFFTAWNVTCAIVLGASCILGIAVPTSPSGSINDSSTPSSSTRGNAPVLFFQYSVPAWASVWAFPSSIAAARGNNPCLLIPPVQFSMGVVCRMLGCAAVAWFSIYYQTIPSFSIIVATIPCIEVVVRSLIVNTLFRGVILPWLVIGSAPSRAAQNSEAESTVVGGLVGSNRHVNILPEAIVAHQREKCKVATLSTFGTIVCTNRWFIAATAFYLDGRIAQKSSRVGPRNNGGSLLLHRRSIMCLVGEVLIGLGLADVNLTQKSACQPAYTDTVDSLAKDARACSSSLLLQHWGHVNSAVFSSRVSQLAAQWPHSGRNVRVLLQLFFARVAGGCLVISALVPFVLCTTLTITAIFFPGSALFTDQHEWVYGGATLFNSVLVVMMVYGVLQFAHWVLIAFWPLLVEFREARRLRTKKYGRRRDIPGVPSHSNSRAENGFGTDFPPPPTVDSASAHTLYPPPPKQSEGAVYRPLSGGHAVVNGTALIPPSPPVLPHSLVNVQDGEGEATGALHSSHNKRVGDTLSFVDSIERLTMVIFSQEIVPLAIRVLELEGLRIHEL
jgi:hypothetical protein